MKNNCLFICTFLLAMTVSVWGTSLDNGSFEDPVLADGVTDVNVPTDWNTTKPSSVYWTMNPTVEYELGPTDGDNFLFMSPAGPSANIYQITTDTVAADTLYVLEFDVSCLAAHFGTDITQHAYYVISWLAGGESVYAGEVTFLSKPSWTRMRITFNSSDFPSTVGDTMQIYFSGKKIALDNIQLNALTPRTLTIQVQPDDIGIDSVMPPVGQAVYADGQVINVSADDFLAIPDSYYHFSHWTGDVVDTSQPKTTVTMDADKTITAVYELDRRECIQHSGGSLFLNPGFEKPVLAEGALEPNEVPDWTIDSDPTDVHWIVNTTGSWTVQPTEGENLLYLSPAGPSAQVSQIVPGIIEPDTVYTLSFDAATPSSYSGSPHYLVLWYSAKNGAQNRTSSYTLLNTGVVELTETDTWTTVNLQWDSTGSPFAEFQQFDIAINGKGLMVDNVRITPQGQWTADVVLDIDADAQAANDIYLANSQFELPVLAQGDNEADELPGWTIDSDPTDVHWVFRPTDTYSLPPSAGKNLLYLAPAGPTAQVSQITEAIIEPNSVYQLTFDVASPASYVGSPFYYVKLYATKNSASNRVSSYLLYDGPVTDILTRDAWQQVTVEIDTTDSPHAGVNQFDIVLGGKAAFDNVSLKRLTAGQEQAIWPKPGQYVYDYNDMVSIYHSGVSAKCPDKLYLFDGWQGDINDELDGSATVVMRSDKTIKALYNLDPDYVPQCGDICNPISSTDLNQDCFTDLYDFALFSSFWLELIP